MQTRMDSFDVMGCQFSYLAVTPGSKIADPVNGFLEVKYPETMQAFIPNLQRIIQTKNYLVDQFPCTRDRQCRI